MEVADREMVESVSAHSNLIGQAFWDTDHKFTFSYDRSGKVDQSGDGEDILVQRVASP